MLTSFELMRSNHLKLMDFISTLEADTPLESILDNQGQSIDEFWAIVSIMYRLNVKVRVEEILGKVFVKPLLGDDRAIFMELRDNSTNSNHKNENHKRFQEIQEHILYNLSFLDGTSTDIYIHKMVFIDEKLSIVYECCLDHSLNSNTIDEIESFSKIDKLYNPIYTLLEVGDYISAIRSLNGNEDRLILKINSNTELDLNTSYHYWGNPYVTINNKGDRIWSATVERSAPLLEWLYSIKSKTEILFPEKIKQSLQEIHLKKMEEAKKYLKKAS